MSLSALGVQCPFDIDLKKSFQYIIRIGLLDVFRAQNPSDKGSYQILRQAFVHSSTPYLPGAQKIHDAIIETLDAYACFPSFLWKVRMMSIDPVNLNLSAEIKVWLDNLTTNKGLNCHPMATDAIVNSLKGIASKIFLLSDSFFNFSILSDEEDDTSEILESAQKNHTRSRILESGVGNLGPKLENMILNIYGVLNRIVGL